MPVFDRYSRNSVALSKEKKPFTATIAQAVQSVCLLALIPACIPSASAASLSRSLDVNGTPAAVWSIIGPFCAIKDWLPPIGACTEDGNTPPTRTLVTKDGKATFVELETARNDAEHTYTYTFLSSPLPVTHYTSTIEVVEKSAGISTITWSSTYIPDAGKEKDASDALGGVYEAGLSAIETRLAE